MTEDEHRAIEELLAGYALGALSGEDAAAADRALERHVSACPSCRETLDAFRGVAGDLALAADTIRPPDTLLPRLRRELEPRSGRGRPARLVAAAASVLLIVGLGGLGLARLDGDAAPLVALSSQDLQQALALAERDDARTDALGPATEVSAPGLDRFYVYGTAVPQPPPGSVYRLWLVSDGAARHLGDFVPAPDGTVVLRIDVDPAGWDVVVTVEPAGSEPVSPGEPAWSTAG